MKIGKKKRRCHERDILAAKKKSRDDASEPQERLCLATSPPPPKTPTSKKHCPVTMNQIHDAITMLLDNVTNNLQERVNIISSLLRKLQAKAGPIVTVNVTPCGSTQTSDHCNESVSTDFTTLESTQTDHETVAMTPPPVAMVAPAIPSLQWAETIAFDPKAFQEKITKDGDVIV